jgi:hypothetical protein
MADRPRRQDAALIGACEIANSDEDLRAIEREFDLIGGDIAEPWRNGAMIASRLLKG